MSKRDYYLSKPWLRYYDEETPPIVDVPEKSLAQLFDDATTKYANQPAMIFYGNKISFKQLRDRVDRFATALSHLGVVKGDRVALYLLNSPQYVIAYLSILKIGGIVTPISPVYTSGEVKHQLTDSGARTIICEEILYDKVAVTGIKLDRIILTKVSEYLPSIRRMFGKGKLHKTFSQLDPSASTSIKSKNFYRMQDLIKISPPDPPVVEIDPARDLAALPYTGGTTALPKGVMLTHRNLVSCQVQLKATWHVLKEGKEVVIAFLPFYHIYGQVVIMLNSLLMGFNMILFTAPDVDEILFAAHRYQASTFFGVPTFYEYLKEYEKTKRVNWKRFKIILCGGDTLHEKTVHDWYQRTGSKFIEGYAMTETSSAGHVNPLGRTKIGSFGVPFPNIISAVVDPDTNAFLPPGEVGELIINGPNVMQGYWNRDDDNAKALIEIDGMTWLKTGDLVRMDEEGYFYFVERKKDLIKYKGFSVFAREIEEIIFAHPQVKAVGVIGVPDPKVGQYIKAYVVLHPEARGKISEEEISNYCKEKLAYYKVPKVVEFRGELPKTDVGKISHRELREEGV